MFKFNIYIFISLLIVQCIPSSPTYSESDDSINDYGITPPDNFTVVAYNSALHINLMHKNRENIDGYLFFMIEEGKPIETTKKLLDKNTFQFSSNLPSLEPIQTYGIQSFNNMPFNCESIDTIDINQQKCEFFSDIKTYTLDYFIPFPTILIPMSNNELIIMIPNYQNKEIISLEYAADSINFKNILTHQYTTSNTNDRILKYLNFRDDFNNDLDGIFKFSIALNDSSTNKPRIINTAESSTSKCDSNVPSKNIELRIDDSVVVENYTTLTWDLYDQCYDQIFIYEVDQINGDENLVEIYFPKETRSIFISDSELLPLTFLIGGNRFGDKVYKSNPITIN